MIGCNSTDDEMEEREREGTSLLEKRVAELEDWRFRLASHVNACPLGWHNDKMITSRSTTDAEVVEWLAKLHQLAEER